ncbi:MAG: shikimate dehydrogenase, partial [Candidatus Alkanophagales archaeon]
MKKVYGVIGDPIEHSLSPVMHNAAFEALGL